MEQLKKGSQIAVLSLGTMAKTVAAALDTLHESEAFAHYDLCFAKPLDEEMLQHIFKTYSAVMIVEEGVKHGGVGSAILEFSSRHQYSLPIQLEGVEDVFVPHGNASELLVEIGLDASTLAKKMELLLNKVLG
jgi:1-deoxy-D-xylulose-5-phosphate synthase